MLDYLVLFMGAILGGSSIYLVKNDQSRRLKLLLSFSGAFLFAVTVLNLIPEVYQSGNHYTGVFILLGFGFQVILEQFSEGVEHGHIHKHQHPKSIFPFGIMLSLCLHAFLEGMPLAQHSNEPLLLGIALHHVPAAFALGSILVEHQLNKQKVFASLITFALMSPLGLFLSNFVSETGAYNLSAYFNGMMAVVIGIFLHISTTILFESSVDHRFNRQKIVAIVSGAGIALTYFLL